MQTIASLSSDALYLQFELAVTTPLVETPHAVQRPAEPHRQDCEYSLQVQQTLVGPHPDFVWTIIIETGVWWWICS